MAWRRRSSSGRRQISAQPPGWREPRTAATQTRAHAWSATERRSPPMGKATRIRRHDHDPAITRRRSSAIRARCTAGGPGEAGQPVRGLRHGQAPDHQEEVQRQLLLRTRCDAGAGPGRQVCHETERVAPARARPPASAPTTAGTARSAGRGRVLQRDHGGDHQHAGERRRVADERSIPARARPAPASQPRSPGSRAVPRGRRTSREGAQHADEQEGGRIDDLEDAQGRGRSRPEALGRGTAGAAMTSRRPGWRAHSRNPPAFRVRWRAGDAREWPIQVPERRRAARQRARPAAVREDDGGHATLQRAPGGQQLGPGRPVPEEVGLDLVGRGAG